MQNKIWLLAAFVIALVGGYYFYQKGQIKNITSFEDCVKAGYPTVESELFPAKCTTPNGTIFTEPSFTQIVDNQAVFAIFTNGTFRIFTDPKYHNLSTDVYIEATNPNIIKVKKPAITWRDFFQTLPMKLTKECLTTGTGQQFCSGEDGTLKFFLNGESEPNLLDKEIQNGDQALITFGNETDDEINLQLGKIPDAK